MNVTTPNVDTIICGDCLEEMKKLPDKSVDMILCDLPYGTSNCRWDTIIPFEALWSEYNRIVKDHAPIVLTASQPFTSTLILSNASNFKYELVWLKNQGKEPQMCNMRPQKAHENIVVFCKSKTVYNPQYWQDVPYNKKAATEPQSAVHAPGFYGLGKRNQKQRYPLSYLYFPCVSCPEHPTQKPLELFEYLIKTYTNEGDLVLDNCIGSGTTAVAAKRTGRHFIGIELSSEYCEIARKRVAAVPARLDRWAEADA